MSKEMGLTNDVGEARERHGNVGGPHLGAVFAEGQHGPEGLFASGPERGFLLLVGSEDEFTCLVAFRNCLAEGNVLLHLRCLDQDILFVQHTPAGLPENLP